MLDSSFDHSPTRNHTPLPDDLIEKRHANVKILLAFFCLMIVISVVAVGAWYIYHFYNTPLIQINSENDESLTILPSKISAVNPSIENTDKGEIPTSWSSKKSIECNTIFRIPPTEEPYIIPRDPNTPPSSIDDEGKYWIFEEYESPLLMLKNVARVIFKNPEFPGSGYVSSAVEIHCAKNNQDFTTESFFVKIQNDLLENYSVIKLKTMGGTKLWEREVRIAKFQGGTFDENDIYYIFATESHIYMIRLFGETLNSDIQTVRDQILLGLQFE